VKSITLKAPAKINLYLDVVNRRKDGYHNIVTLFQKIGLYDTVKVALTPKEISLKCCHPDVPCDETNIAYKAAAVMIKEFKLDKGVSVDITKKIPVAGGLGGGSSDAAATIEAVRRMFKLKASTKRLMGLAKRIGADVPFFVSGYNCAIGTGIGERLKEVKRRRGFSILLLTPNLKIYTKTIYKSLKLPLTKSPCDVNIITHFLTAKKNRDKAAWPLLYNRLEDIVLPEYCLVRQCKDILSLYAERTLLSGSGPTLFGIFSIRKEAMEAKREIAKGNRWQLVLTEAI
jgi:4-diphosphocytidyl-2-C-methyl-D-erythritol kinase